MTNRGGVVTVLWNRFLGDRDVEYRVVARYSPGLPGKTFGPPEDCYPPEQSEVECLEVFEIDPVGRTQKRIDMGAFLESLTKEQDAELQEHLLFGAEDFGTDQESAAADDAYDRMREDR